MPPRKAAPAAKPLAAQPNAKVKLPPFEEDLPVVWFINAKAFFEIKGLIHSGHSPHSRNGCINPLPANAYQKLKEQLFRLFDLVEKNCLDKLYAMPPLDGQHTSELL